MEVDNEQVKELVENSVELQKKSVELIDSFNKLSGKIDELLNVFKIAAKNIEKGEVEVPLSRKLEALLEQNKQIARGLILLEKYVREKSDVPNFLEKKSQ
jgi:hypothetical protein